MEREYRDHQDQESHEFEGAADAAEARLTAYVLDELDPRERAEVEALLARDPAAREQVEQLRELTGELRGELAAEARANPAPVLAPAQRQAIEERLGGARVRVLPRWLVPALAATLLGAVGIWQLQHRADLAAPGRVLQVAPSDARVELNKLAQREERDKSGATNAAGEAVRKDEAPATRIESNQTGAVAKEEPAAK